MKPGLYIVGTPIGNLGDVTTRSLDTLRDVDIILAEDTRHSRILLDRYQIRGNLVSCHRFNERARAQFVLDKIQAGRSLALVTNAGMPGVADPGAVVVQACRQHGLYVTVIPGPSSVSAALALSGFGGHGFLCEGFLTRKRGPRLRRLAELKALNMPVVILESPYRCLRLLGELNDVFQDRLMFLGRELTKINEECLWGTANDINHRLSERMRATMARRIKGELIVVIAPPPGGNSGKMNDYSGEDIEPDANEPGEEDAAAPEPSRESRL